MNKLRLLFPFQSLLPTVFSAAYSSHSTESLSRNPRFGEERLEVHKELDPFNPCGTASGRTLENGWGWWLISLFTTCTEVGLTKDKHTKKWQAKKWSSGNESMSIYSLNFPVRDGFQGPSSLGVVEMHHWNRSWFHYHLDWNKRFVLSSLVEIKFTKPFGVGVRKCFS